MKFVFDTYAWVEYFLGSKKGQIVENYLKHEVITPFIVLLELSYRADKEKWDFKKHFDFIKFHSKIATLSEEFILEFGSLYNKTKRQIPNIGMADIIVLMTAIKENAQLVTGDEHFKNLPQVIFLD